jgi:hypothetical protein
MPEAEVSLRLALYLLRQGRTQGDVLVAIDGAQVQTRGTVHFPMEAFLEHEGLVPAQGATGWRSRYTVPGCEYALVIHSQPGQGDVVAPLTNGSLLRAESKKGPLIRKKSSPEYPLLREALGQLLTVAEAGEDDLLAVAVPSAPKFRELTERWTGAPLVSRLGLRFLLVARDGTVSGLPC